MYTMKSTKSASASVEDMKQSSIVKKGKNCLQVAENALAQLRSGKSVEARSHLCLLMQDAITLASEAEYLAKRLGEVDKLYQEEDDKLSIQTGELGEKEKKLNREKQDIENKLNGQQSVLRDKEEKLSTAERNLQAAERKLREAKKEEERIQIGSTIGGVLFGLATGVAGFLVGAAVGAGIGAIVNACRDEEKNARSAKDRRKEDVESAQSDVRRSKEQISTLESQISSLISLQINPLKKQHEQIHQKRGEIKAAIPIVKKSIEFWNMFELLAREGENRTTLLEKIVATANDEGDYHSLQTEATQRIANTFFEAWEAIESMACEGATNHLFFIDYKCVKCKSRCNALPHLSGSDFVCSTCHLAIIN